MTLVPVHRVDADVAILGSGFAGAITALALRRLGRSVVLLERGLHPRFAIGESSTPLANLLIEELADRYDLPRLRPFSKWGTWQAARPEVACGLKRGFTFFRHDRDVAFVDSDAHERQLLVAASPHDAIADTHWYRPDFDHWLVREAEAEGAIHLDETRVTRVGFEGDLVSVDASRHGRTLRVHARFLVDASGPRGALYRALDLGDAPTAWLPPTQGLYTHFTGVARWDALYPQTSTPPYGVDDAALHHVFPGGWMWVLRFNNGVTSAGVAVTDDISRELNLADGAPAWTRLLNALPSVRRQFADAEAVLPFVHAPRVAFRCRAVAGPQWALLPSAVGVIDPLLSTGFPLTLLGIGRLVEILDRTWSGHGRPEALEAYARDTQAELDATERLVAALYASMSDFALFKRLGLLYFAAASYAEAVRRLGHPERAPGFLLHADPRFGPALRACSLAALALPPAPSRSPSGAALTAAAGSSARGELIEAIDRAIEPYDTAGLLDRSRRDWYPVRADDLLAGATKLGASANEIERLLERCGFADVLSNAQNSSAALQ
jgi:tetracycline 7-halogenase / FADH2 O2-dependent halogenase